MNAETTVNFTQALAEERLPWHKPQVQQLVVTLDTGFGGGSRIDGDSFGIREILSDARAKHDIASIQNALGGILALNGVTYRYNTVKYPDLGLSDEPQIGFLAQELEQVYPQVVTTRKDGFKAVNYALLVPVLVEAIKQQQAMIEDLQSQVKDLQGRRVD